MGAITQSMSIIKDATGDLIGLKMKKKCKAVSKVSDLDDEVLVIRKLLLFSDADKLATTCHSNHYLK